MKGCSTGLGSALVSSAGDRVSRSRTLKIVAARRRNQHSRRVRYPEGIAR